MVTFGRHGLHINEGGRWVTFSITHQFIRLAWANKTGREWMIRWHTRKTY